MSEREPASGDSVKRRGYHSPRRRATAEDTRVAVLAAAAELFARRGWSATGMRDIARHAQVSVETVYATAGPKADLLMRVLDVGVVGDDEPVALASRTEFAAMAEGDRRTRIEAAAGLLTGLNERAAPLNRTFAHAAAGDTELGERWKQVRARQRATFHLGLALVLGEEPEPELVDSVWAIGSYEVYLLLTESAGWSREQYHRWLGDSLDRHLAHLPEEKK